MQTRRRVPFPLAVMALAVLVSMLLAACGSSASTPTTASTPGSTNNKPLIDVSIGLGYIPDIQFAPFYVALSKGYYKAAGLNVTLNHGVVTDLFGEMMSNKDTFVFATGDETLVARSKNLPVVDVSTLYQRYPVSLIVPASSPIKTLADFKGHTIGEPGPFGSTHIGVLALLHQAGLSTSDVTLKSIGFTQVSALKQGRVDAVVGYTNNEPLQLKRLGMQVRTFDVSDYQPLISNGIVTTESTLHDQNLNVVQPFVQATLKGLQDVIANPAEALQIGKSYIPGMKTDVAMDELQATIPIWKGSGQHALGYNDSAVWQTMAQFLAGQKLIPANLDVSKAFVNA
ncbi:MAG TPA: ABC transporter substrate-binding protein [Ktedonobacteraceae bacterium]|nr:ABC transporter substrate-binding protein [Ktedonobacteraceae bacterium]